MLISSSFGNAPFPRPATWFKFTGSPRLASFRKPRPNRLECTPKLIQKTKPKFQRKGKTLMRQSPERYAPEFKLGLVQRMLAGEVPAAVAKETGVPRRLLYHWRMKYGEHGPDGLRPYGRPRKIQVSQGAASSTRANKRMAELERKVGHQELVIDFFETALHRVREKSEANKHVGGNKCTA